MHMGWKHKRRREPYRKTARNSRRDAHVYHPVDADNVHRFASHGGRCHKCGKITDCFCDKCNKWACESHLEKENEIDVCEDCRGKEFLSQFSP